MARIQGTARADVLRGTNDDDVIFTNGGGSDIVRTGGGNDRIVLAGDDDAAIISGDFDPGSDVFDLSEAGLSRDDISIVETTTIEANRATSGEGGLGGLEVQIDGGELIALPQLSSVNDLDINRNFIFAGDSSDSASDNNQQPAANQQNAPAPQAGSQSGNVSSPADASGLNVVDNIVGGNLNGTGGDDLIIGGSGRGGELISGGGGNDVIDGNGGFDIAGGGAGDDRFIVAADDGTEFGIIDFDINGNVPDKLDFSDLDVDVADVQIVASDSLAGGTDIIADGAQTINLQNVDPDQVDLDRIAIFGDNNNATASNDSNSNSNAGVSNDNNGSSNNNNAGAQSNGSLNVVDNVVGGNLNGTGADDLLIGGSGRGGEIISGVGGDDVIDGNGGFDIIGGGSGNDTIIVARDDGAQTGIFDFESGRDTLVFEGGNAGSVRLQASDSNAGGTDVFVDGFQAVNIQNLDPDEIDVDNDFDFGDVDAAVA